MHLIHIIPHKIKTNILRVFDLKYEGAKCIFTESHTPSNKNESVPGCVLVNTI